MCGIVISAFLGQKTTAADSHLSEYDDLKLQLQQANSKRGPDSQRSHEDTIHGSAENDISLECYSSELWLRGDSLVVQPHVHPASGNVLCWNGEIFDGLSISPHENDGARLSAELSSLTSHEQLVAFFSSIEGPYAFGYYHRASRHLLFARDPLGRRSLLVHAPTRAAPWFVLASDAAGARAGCALAEVGTACVYALDLGALAGAEDPVAEFSSCLRELPRDADPTASGGHCKYALPARINDAAPPIAEIDRTSRSFDELQSELSESVDGLISQLDRSVKLRVESIPRPSSPRSARVAVLFSGGIDSTMCAFLASRHVPPDEPIDLLNVAFENPRKLQAQTELAAGGQTKKEKRARRLQKANAALPEDSSGGEVDYNVPDRQTGLQELEELRRVCPGRTWNFVEINVPYAEYQATRSIVEAIMWPRRTVMDLSLAMALYCASRGVGQVRDLPSDSPRPYTSAARVLLNGLGSDELLGGYGRHRTAYKHCSWGGVVKELQTEVDRIPTRNMGRDDRVVSSHGKEMRHPFLSLDVVDFIARLPVHHKMDFGLEAGLGDKLLLRLAAHKLGLVEASTRKKRAMQFGTHSARIEAGVPNDGEELL